MTRLAKRDPVVPRAIAFVILINLILLKVVSFVGALLVVVAVIWQKLVPTLSKFSKRCMTVKVHYKLLHLHNCSCVLCPSLVVYLVLVWTRFDRYIWRWQRIKFSGFLMIIFCTYKGVCFVRINHHSATCTFWWSNVLFRFGKVRGCGVWSQLQHGSTTWKL